MSAKSIARQHLDRHWFAVPVLILLVAAVQALRKWRFERRHQELR